MCQFVTALLPLSYYLIVQIAPNYPFISSVPFSDS